MGDLNGNADGWWENWPAVATIVLAVVYFVVYGIASLVAGARCMEMGFPGSHVTPFFEPYCGRTVSGTEYVVPMFDAVEGNLPWEAK